MYFIFSLLVASLLLANDINVETFTFQPGEISARAFYIDRVSDVQVNTVVSSRGKSGRAYYRYEILIPIVLETERDELYVNVMFVHEGKQKSRGELLRFIQSKQQEFIDQFDNPYTEEVTVVFYPNDDLNKRFAEVEFNTNVSRKTWDKIKGWFD